MSQTANIISPCSRLNDDVLREIFIHCTGDPFRQNLSECFLIPVYCKSSICGHPQLSVSQVCSSWRDIALLTPQLWDNIHIHYRTEADLNTAREYLSRAKNLPVSITIGRPMTAELPWQDWCSQLTDFLSSYRIRILFLMALTVAEKVPLVLAGLSQRSVAELEVLSIVTDLDQEEEQIDLDEARYPKLVDVFICGPYKISSFNSSSLRKFDGRSLSMTVIESWDLLSRCPSLEKLRLNITQSGSWRPVSMPQIYLQYLRILVLRSESEVTFSTFIEELTLPVLEDLHVIHGWSATAFQSLAHRSNYFPHLRDFDLTAISTTTAVVDAGALLALMPCLTSIYLPGLSTIFDHLALDGLASGSLAHRLQTLRAGCISNTGSFLDMVESRMENAQMSSDGVPAPFKKVVFRTYYRDHRLHSDRLRVRDMRQRGIPIYKARTQASSTL